LRAGFIFGCDDALQLCAGLAVFGLALGFPRGFLRYRCALRSNRGSILNADRGSILDAD
jgi:hypothetical protein